MALGLVKITNMAILPNGLSESELASTILSTAAKAIVKRGK